MKRRTVLQASVPLIATLSNGAALAQTSSLNCELPQAAQSAEDFGFDEPDWMRSKGTPRGRPDDLSRATVFEPLGVPGKGSPYNTLYIDQNANPVSAPSADPATSSCYASFIGGNHASNGL